jgi:hypothetical protein
LPTDACTPRASVGRNICLKPLCSGFALASPSRRRRNRRNAARTPRCEAGPYPSRLAW